MAISPQSPPPLLSTREVCTLTLRSRSTLYREVRAGRFPAPLQLGRNRIGWLAAQVAAWVASRPLAGGEVRS